MNSSHRHTHTDSRTGLRRPTAAAGSHRRGGAALIVVISLLGTLAFLGFLFYSFAAQEVASAEYFSRSETPDVPLPPDVFFDWSLQQLIVGTDAALTNSALYGNKYSILANMLGSPHSADLSWGTGASPFEGDTQPFDGAGITPVMGTPNGTYLTANSPMEFGFDVNQDGVYDPTTEPSWETFIMNFSPAADSPIAGGPYTANGTPFSGSTFYRDYQPDAGYTYPDINSLFLGYDTTVRGWPNGANATPRDYRVIIPSFFRPQLFPTRRGTNDNTGGNPSGTNPNGFADIYLADQTARQVLRPHVAHWAGVSSITGNPVRRFVPPAILAYAGELDGPDENGDMIPDGILAKSGDTSRVIRPFPFVVDLDNDGNAGNFNEMGVWTNPRQGQVTPDNLVNYELDVDADGDGVRDAIWIDLDFPMMTLDDGRQFVPIFAVKIIDADALLNVNAHGNAHGLYVRLQNGTIKVIGPDATSIVGASGLAENLSFHQSNQGLSPSEVNLSLALTADLRNPDHVDPRMADPVSTTTEADSVASQFELATNYGYTPAAAYGTGSPEFSSPSPAATSNLETQMILNGRRVFERLRNGTVRETRQQVLGRHGDRFKIRELYARLVGGLSDDEELPGPLPGGFNLDDDGDSNQTGLAPFFGGSGDDDIDAPGIGTTPPNTRRGGGSYYYDQDLYGVQIPPAVHPLDVLGTGSGIYDRTPAMSEFLTRQLGDLNAPGWPVAMTNNPSVFASYRDPWGIAAEIGGTEFPRNFWHYNGTPDDDSEPDLTGVLPWRLGLGAIPNMPPNAYTPGFLDENNWLYDFLIDEPNEVILEPELRNPEYDSVFPVYEMEGLHLSKSDAAKIKAANRLSELAPVNLKRVKEEVRSRIARRLTTDSWDRLEPGQTRYRSPDGGTTPAFRFFEYNNWTGAGTDFATAEETFPPEFGPAATPIPAGSATDPFRPELRLLLKNERLYSGGVTGELRYPRKRLNLNRILSGENPAAPGGPADIDRRVFDDEGEPRFRQLTPHPNITQLEELYGPGAVNAGNITIPPMIHDHFLLGTDYTSVSGPPAGVPPFDDLGIDPSTSQADRERLVIAQEWWARYDRQRLARDIYTLLYLLGGGLDHVNVLENIDTNTGTPAEPYPVTATTDLDGNGVNDHLEAMAQFAVNYVDGLDHDNVITKFEYDINLSNGWESTPGSGDLRVVNGVEAQQLTFSEVVWTIARDPGSDNGRTAWTDDDHEHQFLHIELRSTSPFETVLGNESYRIVREENVPSGTPATRPAVLTFKRDGGENALTVGPGENFTIGTTDGILTNALDVADFYIDVDGDSMWECLVPAGTATEADPSATTVKPKTDLDLVTSQVKPGMALYSEYFTLDSGGTDKNGNTLGTNLVGTTAATDSNDSFYLVLERRRHLNAEGMLGQTVSGGIPPTDPVEDWIEVDRILVRANEFNPASDTQTDMETARNSVRSDYRLEPLNAPQDFTLTTRTTGDVATHPNHTIADFWDRDNPAVENPYRHSNNVAMPGTLPDPTTGTAPTTTPFTLWQPHFDRDYSSIFELLAVPLFGPDELTRRLADGAGKISGLDKGDASATPAVPVRPALAGRLFMNTDPLDDTTYDSLTGTWMGLEDDNRWYRILEFLEVPNRAEEAIRERMTKLVRTPGKINLNTLRDEQALAALVDDLFLAKFADPNGRMTTSDPGLEPLGAGSDLNPGPGNLPTYEDARNWMDELRLARDGIDPVNFFATNANDRTYLPLPGIPGMVGDPNDTSIEYTNGRPQFGAVPFRPLSYVSPLQSLSVDTNGTPHESPISPTAHTILRSHVGPVSRDGAVRISRKADLDELQLFEARPTTDVGVDEYDYHTRNRLLAKLANNSTERSNVFICWIVVEFFEAHQPDPVGNPQIVQVGGKLEGSPTHRGFFIIDRSRIERAVDQDSVTNAGNGNGRDDNFRFDWREFVIHRRTIQ